MYAISSTLELKISILHKLASCSPLVSAPRRSSRLIHAAITAEAGPLLLRLPKAACALHVARRRASPAPRLQSFHQQQNEKRTVITVCFRCCCRLQVAGAAARRADPWKAERARRPDEHRADMRLLMTLFMLPPTAKRQEQLLRAADGEAVVIGGACGGGRELCSPSRYPAKRRFPRNSRPIDSRHYYVI